VIERPFWLRRVERAWAEAPIAWLCGVRRCGKTTLAEALGPERATFVNCDLPAAEQMLADPVVFFRSCEKPIVVLDEVHQLSDPSRVLKIAADVFPGLKVLATGSSTLAASRKFRDSLAGRKRTVHLLPVLWEELPAFRASLIRRLHHGGLPQALLAERKEPSLYREWLDSFFARDVQRLFGFRDVNRFTAFFEHVLRQSGGAFEQRGAAAALGIARPTVESHMRALEITNAATLIRPFHGGGQGEIVRMPKVYGFDTGFVSFARGWDPLRPDDLGVLWEHLVLEHLQARFPDTPIRYWKDNAGRELDFVLAAGRDEVDAVECKWNPGAFDSKALRVFRSRYPNGRNYLVTPSGDPPYTKALEGMDVLVCTPTAIASSSASETDSTT
jgi:hypothetical protein